jgi:TPR repeat protein
MEKIEEFTNKAKGGDVSAMTYLAYSYMKGADGFPKDKDQCFHWVTEANQAEPSDVYILNLLGYCYERGIGVSKDQVKSFEFYFKSAIFGSGYGLLALGNRYEERIQDWSHAAECYAAAAKAGEVNGWFFLGYLYERGGGSAKSLDGEINYVMIELALDPVISEEGIKHTRRKLNGKGPILKQDLQKAFECYKMFDSLVSNDDLKPTFDGLADDETGDDCIFLALIHHKGLGVPQDLAKAYQYYKLASTKSERGEKLFTGFCDPDYYHRLLFGQTPLSKETIEKYEKTKI